MRLRNAFCAGTLCTIALVAGLNVVSAARANPPGAAHTAGGTPTQTNAAAQPGTPAKSLVPAPLKAPFTRSAPVWQGVVANRLTQRAEMFYEGAWGVSELQVKYAESGELIRFNYRVLDPAKAAALNDKKAVPALYDLQAGVKLTVPQMENVGKLRQESTPRAGMTYWMAFSNPTRAVKRGHRVNVVIGTFQATNLVVE